MKSIIVALGDRRYRVERPWPTSDHSFQAICDVAVLADGRVAALRRRTPEVQLFSAAGELVDEWTVSGLVSRQDRKSVVSATWRRITGMRAVGEICVEGSLHRAR